MRSFDVGSVPFYFVDGVINIHAEMPRIQLRAAAKKVPNLVAGHHRHLCQAYFLGDEGNSNEQQGKWFAQLLRQPAQATRQSNRPGQLPP